MANYVMQHPRDDNVAMEAVACLKNILSYYSMSSPRSIRNVANLLGVRERARLRIAGVRIPRTIANNRAMAAHMAAQKAKRRQDAYKRLLKAAGKHGGRGKYVRMRENVKRNLGLTNQQMNTVVAMLVSIPIHRFGGYPGDYNTNFIRHIVQSARLNPTPRRYNYNYANRESLPTNASFTRRRNAPFNAHQASHSRVHTFGTIPNSLGHW